ncbi:MAG: MSHA biogenesis protein MshD [Gammaproteobacteria bacterium]|nr:MAG: MSHA biogenesis protein MshD [Gammaproteobacteria bacterium]
MSLAANSTKISPAKISGVTLVELVITIVILSIALVAVVSVYSKAIGQSADPVIYAKSVEIGQAYMDEILTKRFDETSPVGGVPATPVGSLTPVANLGPDAAETSRNLYDDVDDYDFAADGTPEFSTLALVTGGGSGQYVNYSIEVRVAYVNLASGSGELSGLGLSAANSSVKRIDLIVSNPLGTPVTFTAYKGNY